MKVTEEGAEPAPVLSEWGIVGTINDWGQNNTPDLVLVQDGEYFVHKALPLTANDEVKFRKNNNWGGDVTADPSVCLPNTTINLAGGPGNMKFAAGTYDVYINAECTQCWFMTDGKTPADAQGPVDPTPEPEPEPGSQVWGLVGDPTGWADGKDIALTEADGIWTLAEIDLTAKQGFKFRVNNDYGVQLGGKDDVAIESGVEVSLDNSGGRKNIKVAQGGKYNITLNPAEKTLKMELIGDPIAPDPTPEPAKEIWGLVGAYTGWGDVTKPDYKDDIALTEKEGGIWTLENFELSADKGFKFRVNNDWTKQLGNIDGKVIKAGVEVTLSTDGGSGDLKPEVSGKYNIILNPEAKTLKLEISDELPIF